MDYDDRQQKKFDRWWESMKSEAVDGKDEKEDDRRKTCAYCGFMAGWHAGAVEAMTEFLRVVRLIK